MTTITTNHGTYTGRTVESIIRREYGRKARIWWSADRNDPKAGRIVEWAKKADAWAVQGILHSYDGIREA